MMNMIEHIQLCTKNKMYDVYIAIHFERNQQSYRRYLLLILFTIHITTESYLKRWVGMSHLSTIASLTKYLSKNETFF